MKLIQLKIFRTALVVIVSLIVVLFVIQGFKGVGSAKKGPESSILHIDSKSFPMPDTIFFAGERMPLENIDTRESLEREIIITAYRHSATIMIIKRTPRYFPIIEKILKEYNIPDDFKYLAVAESDLSNQVSPAGATGFWQIMSETGKEQGMEINNEVDERYNIERSTRFACEYFLKSYAKYGNWTLAAASYNGGRNGLDDQIEIQHEKNYYDLLLNEETARYIFRVIAYKLVITDPQLYGFDLTGKDLYPVMRYNEVRVDSAVTDFSRFARIFGTNYKILKMLNPWLRKPYLTNKAGRPYLIKIPAQGFRMGD